MTVADLSTVWLSAQVPETQIRNVQIGEAVRAEFAAYPGEVFRARVMRIAETVDPQTRTIKVEAEATTLTGACGPRCSASPPSPRAFPGARGAGFRGSPEWRGIGGLGRKEPGSLWERSVALGERASGFMPVISGLSAGERIVVDGVTLLRAKDPAQ